MLAVELGLPAGAGAVDGPAEQAAGGEKAPAVRVKSCC